MPHLGSEEADRHHVNVRSGSAWLIAACALLAVPTVIDPDGAVAELTYLIGMGLIVAALWWGATRRNVPSRVPWLLFAGAGSCWLAGDIVQRALAWLGSPEVEVGLPDVLWLASYPLLIAGVIRMIKMRGVSAAFIRDIGLDVVVVGAAASVVATFLLVTPLLTAGGKPIQLLVDYLYPLGDLALFALAITLMLTPGTRGRASILLIGALGLSLPLDLLQAIQPTIAPRFDEARLDGLLLVGNALLGAAAIHPSRISLTERASSRGRHFMNRWRVILLGTSLCAVSVVSTIPDAAPQNRLVAVAASVLVSIAVMIRFYRVVREREEAEVALRFQADHDQLTGVANRFLLMNRVSAALSSQTEAGESLVLAWVDLDGFKLINDSWGHSAGDEVIRTVAGRLSMLVRASDTVARMGGDEFVVLCQGATPQRADQLGQQICEAVGRAIEVDGAEVTVGASVGVVFAEPHTPSSTGDDRLLIDDLLHRADSAMYEAKRAGGGVWIASALSL